MKPLTKFYTEDPKWHEKIGASKEQSGDVLQLRKPVLGQGRSIKIAHFAAPAVAPHDSPEPRALIEARNG